MLELTDIKALKSASGMTNSQMSEFSGIPVRTLENWLSKKRTPPDYVVSLLCYKMVHEGMVKGGDNNASPERSDRQNV